jgi:hypothetical protein
MGLSTVRQIFHLSSPPAVSAAITPEEVASRLEGLQLREESCDEYIARTKSDIEKRDKQARKFVRLTDFAGNAVKPIAIASLIGMGFNPLFALGLGASIVTLAAAFYFRNNLYKQNALLQKAYRDLEGLEVMKASIQREKVPYEKRQKEIEWIVKAAEITRSLKKEETRTIKSDDDDFVIIGGVRLERRKDDTSPSRA